MRIKMSAWLSGYVTILIAFALLDGMWLGLIAMPLYQDAFANLLRESFITWPWVLFYVGYGAAVMVLTVAPMMTKPLLNSVLAGTVLGATAYGTYNLTGYSIIADWPLTMALIDWAWGTIATTILALVGSVVCRVLHVRNRH